MNIFKTDIKFKINKIDFESKEMIEKIENINKKQEDILNRKNINTEHLNKIINI